MYRYGHVICYFSFSSSTQINQTVFRRLSWPHTVVSTTNTANSPHSANTPSAIFFVLYWWSFQKLVAPETFKLKWHICGAYWNIYTWQQILHIIFSLNTLFKIVASMTPFIMPLYRKSRTAAKHDGKNCLR